MENGNFNTIIQDLRPVVVDFHAPWCGPCKAQSPMLKDVAAELGDRIRVIKIDVDQNPEIANRYGIHGCSNPDDFQKWGIEIQTGGCAQQSSISEFIKYKSLKDDEKHW